MRREREEGGGFFFFLFFKVETELNLRSSARFRLPPRPPTRIDTATILTFSRKHSVLPMMMMMMAMAARHTRLYCQLVESFPLSAVIEPSPWLRSDPVLHSGGSDSAARFGSVKWRRFWNYQGLYRELPPLFPPTPRFG